ncbi:MAG TPA: hypothetical protein VNP02_12460, partial [Gammaproteobacteria bacterium]|nr:hypothetical protein [Gammaproteobacteria bacterium]
MGSLSRLLRSGAVSALLAATPVAWAQEPNANPSESTSTNSSATPSSVPTREALQESRATIR